MPLMQNRISLATGVNSNNVLAGLLEEILKRPSAVRLAAVCDGITTTPVQCSFYIGDKLLVDSQAVFVNASAGRVVIPDDVLCQHGGAAGSRLTLKFLNADSVTRIVVWRIDIVPVA